jgi:hypothetical protein
MLRVERPDMTPAGYMAKRVQKRPGWLKAAHIAEIYSLSGGISKEFADYVDYWKHNGFWLFDSPEIIKNLARENSIELDGTSLFYYEVHEKEFDGALWQPYSPEPSFATNVASPLRNQLEGFDIVTFYAKNTPEHSPLSCNSMAEELHTNAHCLFESFEEAETNISKGVFKNAEPGPYRIFSVYSVDWS